MRNPSQVIDLARRRPLIRERKTRRNDNEYHRHMPLRRRRRRRRKPVRQSKRKDWSFRQQSERQFSLSKKLEPFFRQEDQCWQRRLNHRTFASLDPRITLLVGWMKQWIGLFVFLDVSFQSRRRKTNRWIQARPSLFLQRSELISAGSLTSAGRLKGAL